MRSPPFCMVSLVLVASARLALAAPAAPPPVEHFTRYPVVSGVSIAEDAHNLIYLNSDEKNHVGLAGVDLTTMAPFSITLDGDDVYDITWLAGDRVAFNVAMGRRWARGLYTYKLGDKLAEGINDKDLTEIVSVLRDDRTRMYVWYQGGASHRPKGLALIDTDRNPVSGPGRGNEEFMIVRWVPSPPGDVLGWRADWTGQIRLAVTFHDGKKRVWIHEADNERWDELPFDWEFASVNGFTPDGRSLYVVFDDGSADTNGLYRYDLATRTLAELLFRDPDFGLDDGWPVVARKDNALVGVRYYRDGLVTRWLSERFQKYQIAIQEKLPGRVIHITDWDDAETRLVVTAESDRHPDQYFIYQPGKNAASSLPSSAPWIDAAKMQPMQTVRFKARDGLQLQGYLTLPARRADGKKPALVVMPHGGPWVRDTWGWDAQVQFLASRGYAVFQPNYRGSSGFKREVSGERSDFRAMYEDVVDGTAIVARSGFVDPARVAICGGSFGGYLALAGAAFDPDRFKCAVSFAGVFDWARLVEQVRYKRGNGYLRYLRQRDVGDPRTDAERFDEISPIKHAASIKIPLLLVHGADDQVVKEDQTRLLIAALKEHGIKHEALFFKDEGHGFNDPANRAKYFTRLEQFLAKNL